MRGFISAIYNSYRARKDMDGAPCFCRWKSCSKSCASFFLANPRRVVSFFSPVQSVYLIFTYHVPRFVSLWTDKRSSLSGLNSITYFPQPRLSSEKSPGSSLPRLFHWYNGVYLYVLVDYTAYRYIFHATERGVLWMWCIGIPSNIQNIIFWRALCKSGEHETKRHYFFFAIASTAVFFLCFR